jgi:hypothetical protein
MSRTAPPIATFDLRPLAPPQRHQLAFQCFDSLASRRRASRNSSVRPDRLRALTLAIDAGADAVYLGLKDATNARNFAGLNFEDAQVREGVAYAHARGAARC